MCVCVCVCVYIYIFARTQLNRVRHCRNLHVLLPLRRADEAAHIPHRQHTPRPTIATSARIRLPVSCRTPTPQPIQRESARASERARKKRPGESARAPVFCRTPTAQPILNPPSLHPSLSLTLPLSLSLSISRSLSHAHTHTEREREREREREGAVCVLRTHTPVLCRTPTAQPSGLAETSSTSANRRRGCRPRRPPPTAHGLARYLRH